MKISIVLATCNGERYLPEQLNSLSSQTRLPDELIIGDDASEDGTVGIVHGFAKSAPFPTKIIRNGKRLGYKQNFSQLAMQASGDILAFCDQDDVWEPEKLAVLDQYFSRNTGVTCVIHDAAVVDGSGRILAPSYLGQLRESGYSDNVFVKGCATAISAQLARALYPLPPASAWAHDNIAHVVAMMNGSRRIIAQRLMAHRIHGKNVSGFVAPKPTIRHRLNLWIESLEASRVPRELYPILIPKNCAERDLEFLFSAASRLPNESARDAARSRASVRAITMLSSIRDRIRDVPMLDGLRLVRTTMKSGAFQELGGGKIMAMEGLRVLLRSLKRRRPDATLLREEP
jgi:glycosyltransferase involved in cell wall biosynthesis